MKNSDLFKGVYFCQIYEKGNKPNKYYYLFMILKRIFVGVVCVGVLNKKADEYCRVVHQLFYLFEKRLVFLYK